MLYQGVCSGGWRLTRSERLAIVFFSTTICYGGLNNWAIAQSDELASEETDEVIELVIVTATKRSGNLQNTAMSLAVTTEELIRKQGLVGMEDYLRSTPGVSMQDRGAGHNSIIIRGISADPQSAPSTVGIYYGETPITGLGGFRGGTPDVKLVDIDRVEVLRGPQGTLFGEGSMAGTVRVIPKRPDTSGVSGEVSATFSNTANKGGGNAAVHGFFNVPIFEDRVAVRAAFYHYDNSGFYENIAASDPIKETSLGAALGAGLTDAGDVGSSEYSGLRLAAMWQLSERFFVEASYFRQDIDQEGLPEEALRLDPFQQARFDTTSGPESIEHEFEVFNLELEYDFDRFTIFSSSSWLQADHLLNREFGAFVVEVFGGDVPILLLDRTEFDYFVQEARVTTNLDGPVQGLLGFYYADHDDFIKQIVDWGGAPETDPFGGALGFDGRFTDEDTETAVFGELSYSFSEQLEAALGFRYFEYEQADLSILDGPIAGGFFTDAAANEDDETTFKLSVSYTPREDALFYANVQEGFRAGRPHLELAAICDLDGDGLLDGLGIPQPDSVGADGLTSYEAGSKLTLADGRVQIRAAIYHIEWDGMPVVVTADCGFLVTLNAGESESNGLEVEGTAVLGENWKVDFGFSHTDVELSEDHPSLGNAGDPLPGTPDNVVSLGAEYAFQWRGRDSYARLDWAYVDEYYNNFARTGRAIGDYHELDISAGMSFDRFDVVVFVANLTDSDEMLWNDTEVGDGRVQRQRPRTAGVTVRFQF